MYVACRELELQTRKAKPGDSVPEALDWSYPILLAHINMGWIKYVGDGAETQTNGQQPPSPTSKKKSSEKIAKDEPQTEVLSCETCQKKGFKNSRALKIHVTTAHRK